MNEREYIELTRSDRAEERETARFNGDPDPEGAVWIPRARGVYECSWCGYESGRPSWHCTSCLSRMLNTLCVREKYKDKKGGQTND